MNQMRKAGIPLFFVLSFLFFFVPEASAKSNESDSLETLLKKASDGKKPEFLVKLYRLNYAEDGEKSETYFLQLKKLKPTRCSELAIQYIDAYQLYQQKKYKEALEKMPSLVTTKGGECAGIYQYVYRESIKANGELFLVEEAAKTAAAAEAYFKKIKDYELAAKCRMDMGVVYYKAGNVERSGKEFDTAIALFKKTDNKKDLAGVLMNSGIINFRSGKLRESLHYYREAGVVFEEIGDTLSVAHNLINFALTYEALNKKDSLIYYCTKAIPLYEAVSAWNSLANVYDILGGHYVNSGEYDLATAEYVKGLKIRESKDSSFLESSYINISSVYEKIGDTIRQIEFAEKAFYRVMAKPNVYNQNVYKAYMGSLYYKIEAYKKALVYTEEALEYFEANQMKSNIASSLITWGNIHQRLGNLDKALGAFERAMLLKKELGDTESYAGMLSNIGVIYYDKGQYRKSLEYYKKALEIRKELAARKGIYESYLTLSNTYAKMNDYRNAYDYHVLYSSTKDTLLNEERTRAVLELQEQYEAEKKTLENEKLKADIENTELKLSEQDAVLKAEKAKKYIYFSAGGFLLIVIFLVAIGYRNKSKDNRVIKLQKEEVERQHLQLQEKNREILDSITYAKRLQEAILPPQKLVKQYFQNSFIFYKPKDIVAGDFYFMEVAGDTVLFAVADCTGHGVPGAMVSVVCSNALKSAVKDFGLTDPAEILNKVRELVVATFEKSESEVQDGMDIALCALQMLPPLDGKQRGVLQYAGANNPLWIIRKEGNEVQEVKPDKQPVGVYSRATEFTSHRIELEKGDAIYLFSDGYSDQFGGLKGKKFKSSNFKSLLLSFREENMEIQRELIHKAFEEWRSDYEQVDDVCVIGLRI